MDPSDSLQLDQHLARLLAAFDQGIDGGDGKAETIGLPLISPLVYGEQGVVPLTGTDAHEGSLDELLPDHDPSQSRSDLPEPIKTFGSSNGPHRVGRFELRRQLGKGGCGIVFLAYDPKLKREVALKIPRPEMLMSPDARHRLVREALAAAEFDHPNLVSVYETGEIGPVCFVATSFCPGPTLGEWLDKQAYPVPVRQAARLVAIVADAVQHAHDRGVLHRDLKPNNIILSPVKEDPNEQEPPIGTCHLRDDNYLPRVVDFGLAKLMERGGPSDTNTRQILGTPKYMAPEQAQARHADVGPPADVYALGVILYEIVTGRAPYEGASDVEVLRQAIDGNLTRPRLIRADIPGDLEAICLKAMDSSPGKRYRTAIDLADDLRRFLDGLPTLARPLKWPGRAARWLRRNDQVVALSAVIFTAVLLLILGTWKMGKETIYIEKNISPEAMAARLRTDQNREYASAIRTAFTAWRGGDTAAAGEYLKIARGIAGTRGEATDFPHDYLTRLVKAERLRIICPAGDVTALTISADGKRLASGHANGTLAVWNSVTGESIASVHAHERAVGSVSFGGPEEVISADITGQASAWAISDDGLMAGQRLPNASEPPASPISSARHGTTLFTGGGDGIIRGWDAAEGEFSLSAPSVPFAVRAVAISRDGSSFTLATTEPGIISSSGTHPRPSVPIPQPFGCLRQPLVGPMIGVTMRGAEVVAWEIDKSIQLKRSFSPQGGALPKCCDLSADGALLAVGDDLGRVSIWSMAGKNLLVQEINSGQRQPVTRVQFSDDGKRFAAQTSAGIGIWEIGNWKSITTIGTGETISAFRFIPGNQQLATVSFGKPIRIWAINGGREEATLYSGNSLITALAASPDGRTLLSAAANGEVTFWDLRTGLDLMTLRRQSGPLTAIEFARNGKLLVTGGPEVAVWETAKE